nr:succinate-semialdehyde dehydrogenase [Raoultella sp. NCTC 9187]
MGRWRVSTCVTSSIRQVTATLAEGATLLLGGEKLAGAGNYYAPTVLGNVTAEMTGFRQELFGPVATSPWPATPRTPSNWLTTANLACRPPSLTASVEEADRFSRQLECGGVFINATAPATHGWPLVA